LNSHIRHFNNISKLKQIIKENEPSHEKFLYKFEMLKQTPNFNHRLINDFNRMEY